MRYCISVAHTIKPISPHFKASPDTCFGGGGISLCEMTEGADVSNTANLSYIIVGATLAVARRTGTEHLILNAFCVLNYTYVYRDKNRKTGKRGLRSRGRTHGAAPTM